MAVYNVSLIIDVEVIPESGVKITTLTTNPDPINLVRGDVVNFTMVASGSASVQVSSMLVYGFDANIWTSSANSPSLNFGSTFSKTVRSDSVFSTDTIVVDVYYNSGGGDYPQFQVSIVDPTDTTPDAFSLGPDLLNRSPNVETQLNAFIVSGLGTTVTASITNGYFTIDGGTTEYVNASVSNGMSIRPYARASSSYSTTTTTTLTVGSFSDSLNVTTRVNPATTSLFVPSNLSLPVSLNAVKAFFKGPNSLSAYLRGGTYVPNIPENNAIASSLPISLASFVNSGVIFSFTTIPTNKSAFAPYDGTVRNLSLTWALNTDFNITESMKGSVNYRYTVTEYTGGSLNTGVTVQVASGPVGTYNSNNTYITVAASAPATLDRNYAGTITINIQSIQDTSKVLTAVVDYDMVFQGI